ncbi:hypothetical protein EYF80_045693 [Liparis tanakae]|uniref:Uncharacterized protein n=1 Tax=Liparis tanakae TaxID=230148 RepID=A0A4Z2FSC5_9TELE|nr:hypothetical protein EYF80_045693 [Liparis tanakae]
MHSLRQYFLGPKLAGLEACILARASACNTSLQKAFLKMSVGKITSLTVMIFTRFLKMMSPFWRYSMVLRMGKRPFIGMAASFSLHSSTREVQHREALSDDVR